MRLADYSVPTCEPTDVTAGDSLEWDKTLSLFPASQGWELSYALISESGAGATADLAIAFDAVLGPVTANGDVFEVRVSASSTEDLVTGPYRLVATVTDGSTKKSWLAGRVLVHADPAAEVGAKSFSRTMRDTLRTAMSSAASDGAYLSVSVNGRSVTYAREHASAELARYEYLVALEENSAGEISHAVEFVRG